MPVTNLEKLIQQEWDFLNKDKNNFKKVLLHEPTFNHQEILAVVKCMLSTNVTMGKRVLSFENGFCKKFNFLNSVTCNSGSSANLLAISTLTNPELKSHLKKGDEVIVPALSWSTTIWPIIQCGLVPVFVDIDRNTLNINPIQIKKAITKKTKAIMPVHVYGNPCEMSEITKICKDYNLYLIEDCCESMGAKYKNKSVGSFGEIGTFSFYFSHHITTIEGGVAVSNSDNFSELMRILRAHGWIRELKKREKFRKKYKEIDEKFLFVNVGYNLRLNELQAAIGNIQLKKFNGILKKRKTVANRWANILSEFKDIFSFQEVTENADHSWFGFCLTLKNPEKQKIRKFRKFLSENGIENRPIICGNVAKQPAIKNYKHRVIGTLENSNYVMNNSFSIGCHQNISYESQKYAFKVFKKFLS